MADMLHEKMYSGMNQPPAYDKGGSCSPRAQAPRQLYSPPPSATPISITGGMSNFPSPAPRQIFAVPPAAAASPCQQPCATTQMGQINAPSGPGQQYYAMSDPDQNLYQIHSNPQPHLPSQVSWPQLMQPQTQPTFQQPTSQVMQPQVTQQTISQHQLSQAMSNQSSYSQPKFHQTYPLQSLGEAVAPVACPVCRETHMTRTQYVSGNVTHLWALGLGMTLGLCCLPYLMSGMKNVNHYCGHCGVLLATWHRGSRTEVHAHT